MSQKQFKLHISRLMALLLCLMLVLPGVPAVSAAEASGTCGSNVSWSLAGGVLTVSGRGDMADYTFDTPAPWHNYAGEIRSVRVEQGVTSVGSYAFCQLNKVTAASLADSVTDIGRCAFYECESLELLDMGNGVQSIGERAFKMCRGLMSVQLPDRLKSIGNQAFYRCQSLMSITVPASVTSMGTEIFMYCSNLCSATVLASVKALPAWTFYGCYGLTSVTMGSSIDSVGQNAFEKCEKLPESFDIADEAQDVDRTHITSDVTEDQIIVTENHYTQQGGSSVNVQTTTQGTLGNTDTSVEVDAVLEDQQNWEHLQEQVQSAVNSADGETIDVNINLKGDGTVSGEDLSRFAGENVDITIHTQQGAYWRVNGQDISAENLQESYNLSFTLRSLTNPTAKQAAAVGDGTSFVVEFAADIDFKVEVELPLGEALARNMAVFFAPDSDGYTRMQAVVIDADGIAHFYLGCIQAKTEYLIGINISNTESDVSDAIVPEQLFNEYPELEQVQQVEYVVTGVKSSWGMDLGQVTGILAAVMIGSVIIVGVVMYILFKRKLKQGYVPDMRYEDEI